MDGTEGTGTPRRGGLPLFNRVLDALWGFVENRLGVSRWPLRPQPAFSFNPAYWTGAFVAVAFVFQAISGMLLLIYYDPSASPLTTGGPPAAWSSTQALMQTVPFGWMLLTTHLYGAYATIFLAFVHFFRGFYTGAYKRPREFSWVFGTCLLLAMLGMGFTGYLLPYTSLSVGATSVGISLATSAQPIGPMIAPFIQGDGTYQGLLSRMFAFHVAVIPVVLVVLLWLHVTLFETHGVAPPASSDPKARRILTHEDDKRLGSWFPKIFIYGTKWALAYVGMLLLIVAAWPATLAPAFGATNQAGVSPEPDWYFLWLYKLADFQGVTPILAMGVLGFLALGILFLPFLDQAPGWVFRRLKNPRTHPRDRPLMLFLATFLLQFFALMTVWGGVMPGILIPTNMFLSYLGALAVVDALLILVLFVRYRQRYARRLAVETPRPMAPIAPVAPPAPTTPGSPSGFWDVRAAVGVIILAGMLVPLGYILTLPNITAEVHQRQFTVAVAIIALAAAALVQLTESAILAAPRPVPEAPPP